MSSLYVCMAIKHLIGLFVETPRKFITAKLSIRKTGSSSVLIICDLFNSHALFIYKSVVICWLASFENCLIKRQINHVISNVVMCKINFSCRGCARVNWNHFTTFEMTWFMCRLIKKILNDASQQITTLLWACELNKSHIISTDEDPGLRIESFAVINLRGVSTNKTIILIKKWVTSVAWVWRRDKKTHSRLIELCLYYIKI
jgi:hypothetical protein